MGAGVGAGAADEDVAEVEAAVVPELEHVLVAELADDVVAAVVEENAEAEFVAADVASGIEAADIEVSACVVVNEAELDGAVGETELERMVEDGGGHAVVIEPVNVFEHVAAALSEVDAVG